MTVHQLSRSFLLSWLIALLFGAGVLAPLRGAAATDAEIRERIREQISLRHPTDTPEFWRGLGPSAPRVIREMLGESRSVYERIRLMEGLGWFDAEEAKETLREAAESEVNRSLLRTELRSLLATPGESAKDEVAFVERFLERSDPAMRAQVAAILAESGSSEALRAIERHLPREKTPWVADRMRRSREESLRLAERARSSNTTSAAIGGRSRVGTLAVEAGLEPGFEGLWEGRWIGVPERPEKGGVLTRTLSIRTRVDKDPSSSGVSGKTLLRVDPLPAVPPAIAPSVSPSSFVLKGGAREARATIGPSAWKSLTAGLGRDSRADAALTLVARLSGNSTLLLQSEDGRQQWIFVRSAESRAR